MSNFDPTLPVQTRTGRKARIICTDLKGSWNIAVAIECRTDGVADGSWEEVRRCDHRGYFSNDKDPLNLVNIPAIPKGLRKLWTVQGALTMDHLIDYLDKEDLVVLPRDLGSFAVGAIRKGVAKWSEVIKAWEEETGD